MTEASGADTAKAKATPTKRLFIDTLTRDVDLKAAIVDLIDNSVDGARRLRPSEDFTGLSVTITVSESEFKLKDDCGGISVELAENYAFRFGKDEETDDHAVKHSVGHFGVGMKRTLFKIARAFVVESTTATSHFKLDLNVETWKQQSGVWEFPLTEVRRGSVEDASEIGTTITVTELRPEAAKQFGQDAFAQELRERIRIAHQEAIRLGLKIVFNSHVLTPEILYLRMSDNLRPARVQRDLQVDQKSVRVEALLGIDERDFANSGWYVFCNGRLLLRADRTKATGWGEGLQKPHQQFDRFRGYLFLDADDASVLPWNTTKTGFSEDSDLYRNLKLEVMENAGRGVTEFLNRLREEEADHKEGKTGSTPLNDAVKNSARVAIDDRSRFEVCTQQFVWPKNGGGAAAARSTKRINYEVPTEQFVVVGSKLGTTKGKDIGLLTFNYYYDMEIGQ